MSEQAIFRVGLIGAGAMAREHGKAFSSLPNVEIVGLVGRTPDRAQKTAECFGTKAFNSLAELYEKANPDLIVICVSTPELSTVIETAVQYPWEIFMEKPPGFNPSDTMRIEQTLRGRIAYVALNRRYLPSTLAVKTELERIPVGDPIFISVQDFQDIDAFASLPGKTILEARNLMYANSIHLIDYFHSLGRCEVDDVQVSEPFHPDRTFCQVARIFYKNGDEGLYQGFWKGAGRWGVRVNTVSGCYTMSPLEDVEFQKAGTRGNEALPLEVNSDNLKPGFKNQAQAVIKAISGNPSDAVTFHDSLGTVYLIRRIYGGFQFT